MVDLITGEGVDEDVSTTIIDPNSADDWAEKYRGHTLADFVLPPHITRMVSTALTHNSFGNYILHSGAPGTGKSSLARAIPEMLGTESLFEFGKNDNEIIDDIEMYSRAKILDGKPRFVIIDEADHPNKPADFYRDLQSIITSTAKTLRFILTCNELWRIPNAIKSRCYPIDFSHAHDTKDMKTRIYERLLKIAAAEVTAAGNVFDKKVAKPTIISIVNSCYPDMREMLNVMKQSFNENNGIICGEPHVIKECVADDVWNLIVAKKVGELRKYISLNVSNCNMLYIPFGRVAEKKLADAAMIDFCPLLAECHYKSQSQVDPEVMFMGFACRVMNMLQKHGM